MTEEVKNQAPTAPEAEQPAQQGADLNISDLVAIKNIIEVAS